MPGLRGANGMFEQYRELMRRVRRAAKSGWLSESWLHMEKVMVQSVMTYGKLNATLGRMSPWKCVSVVARQCIFGLIGHMAGFLAPVGGPGYCSWRLRDTRRELVLDDDGRPGFLAGPPFKVAIGSLAAIGCGSLWRKTRTNRHMKRHRDEFDGSEAQKTLVAMHMQEGGLLRWQAEKRRDDRFGSMLFDKYGGCKALKEVIRIGCLVQIRLGQTHRSLAFRPSKINDIPPRRARYIDNKWRSAKEKKSDRRARYHGNMAEQLRETGVSTVFWQALMCRRIARVLMHR